MRRNGDWILSWRTPAEICLTVVTMSLASRLPRGFSKRPSEGRQPSANWGSSPGKLLQRSRVTASDDVKVCRARPAGRRTDDLERLAVQLLRAEMPLPNSVQLLGVSLSSLETEHEAPPQFHLAM